MINRKDLFRRPGTDSEDAKKLPATAGSFLSSLFTISYGRIYAILFTATAIRDTFLAQVFL